MLITRRPQVQALLGVKIYCDIFGEKALKIANSLNIDGFKIHSSDLNNRHLLDLINDIEPQKKIILSCGGSNIREIHYALNILNNHKDLTLMHGFQSYPTAVSESNLRRLDWLKNNFVKANGMQQNERRYWILTGIDQICHASAYFLIVILFDIYFI